MVCFPSILVIFLVTGLDELPKMEKSKSEAMFRKWEQAVEMSRGWVRENPPQEEEEESSK